MDVKLFCVVAILLVATGPHYSAQISLATDPTYYAGVLELALATEGSAKERVVKNLARVREKIESDETRDLDILVLPEDGLNSKEWRTYVPDPKDKIAPCEHPNYDFFMNELSCMARSRKLYLVANVKEKQLCGNNKNACGEDGFHTYNTNVVFDRHGRVISRYRKTHLYRWEWYSNNVLEKPELATFTTDFGVTFGTFICFDMMFWNPAMVLIREHNITDIVYPTYWFSELPFLTAVQLQEGFAFANNINLLAADVSVPSEQNTGSGIYAGNLGRLTAFITQEPTTRLLKAKVPKKDKRAAYRLPDELQAGAFVAQLDTPRISKASLLRDYNVDVFTTKLLEEKFTAANETVCHGGFCCDFDVKRTAVVESNVHAAYRYRLAAYSGKDVTIQRADPLDLSTCALFACTNEDLYSCGLVFPDNVRVGNKFYFSSITVKGTFRKSERRLIMPNTVDGLLMPLLRSTYDVKEVESAKGTEVTMTLLSPKLDLLTFAIWANYYNPETVNHNLDPQQQPGGVRNGANGLSSQFFTGFLLIGLTILFQFYISKLKSSEVASKKHN